LQAGSADGRGRRASGGPIGTACCTPVLAGQKRIGGRVTALQIASASFVGLRGRSAATVLPTIRLAQAGDGLASRRRDQAHLMAVPGRLPRPILRPRAGPPADQAGKREKKSIIRARLTCRSRTPAPPASAA
jgi:hypothetical protein